MYQDGYGDNADNIDQYDQLNDLAGLEDNM